MNRIKLQLPQNDIRPLHRPHLMVLLDEVFDQNRRLMLVSAPAGFGKTTLVADWAAAHPNVSWLSLDVEDNDVMAFLKYLIAAVRNVEPGTGQEALEMIQSPQPPSHLVVLKALLFDLEKLAHPLGVVLDDYQVISANPVRDIINQMLDILPPTFRLVILTRTDPSINLRRMRVENALVEIRTDDLRFTPEEVDIFLHNCMGLRLSSQETTLLNSRIEGWPAGLQMAALALRGRGDVTDFLHQFSGSSYYILDYLAQAVFDNQEKTLQNFLLKTCVLDTISAPLACAMLAARPISEYEDMPTDASEEDCQQILEGLYRSHMFVTVVDGQHTWFRYHQLFSDLLRTRLHVIDHDAFRELHTQAAGWFHQNGYKIEAVNHVMMAEDEPQTMNLFEQYAADLLRQGDLAALGRWMKMLTENDIRQRAWLCIAQAWVMVFSGRLTGLNDLLDQAERLRSQVDGQKEQSTIDAQMDVIRSFLATMTGNLSAAVKFRKAAARRLNPDDHWANAIHQWVTGATQRMQGNLEQSAQAFEAMQDIGRIINNSWMIVTAATEQGSAYTVQGNLQRARHIFEESLKFAQDGKVQNFGCVSRLKTALATLLYEQGQLKEAMGLVEDAIEGNRFWKNPNHLVYACATRACIQLGGGDLPGARDTLLLADQELRGLPVMGVVSALLNAVKVRMWLVSGDLEAAAEWIDEHAATPLGKQTQLHKKLALYNEDVEINQITAARVMLAQKRIKEAIELLDALEADAIAGGRGRAMLQVMVLRAAALEAAGQTSSALDVLGKALVLASTNGFVRVFVDEGTEMEHLLQTVVEEDREGSDYAAILLPVFRSPRPVIQVRHVLKPAPEKRQAAIQPLSQREKEVLNLIAAGMTNHQIALQLVISTGTVKAHSANIYRKLAAGNRVQAVERARALNLLVHS